MTETKPLSIVVVTDDHYTVLLAALIKSIESNIRKGQKIDMYVVEDNVTEASKKKLRLSTDENITTLIWKKMASIITSDIKLPLDSSSAPLNIYMRLLIPYFIPKEIERVLFMDVDMIVRKDISLLFEYDISDYVVGAVWDPVIRTFDAPWGGVSNYAELGLDGKSKYFNAGLLLINTRKWVEENVTQRVFNFISDNLKYAEFKDQYGLNAILVNRWLELDPLWNHFRTIDHPDPYLIHYIHQKPIYKSYDYDDNQEYKRIFFSYLNQTQWKNFKPIGESKQNFKKAKNKLGKYLIRIKRVFMK